MNATCAFSRARIDEGDRVLIVSYSALGDRKSHEWGGTTELVLECEAYANTQRYPMTPPCPITEIVHGNCTYILYRHIDTDSPLTFFVHAEIVERLLDLELSDYNSVTHTSKHKFVMDVGIPLVRYAQAARIQLRGVGRRLGLVDVEEELLITKVVHEAISHYLPGGSGCLI